MIAALALAAALAAPADDSSIRVAVIPDTQVESYSTSAKRSRWIARRDFDAVAHVGDVTDWGVRDVSQFQRAQKWMDLLPAVPRAVAIGNHDTAAVKVGGSAFDPPNTGTLVRDTSVFNSFAFTTPPRGQFEAGRVDNSWTRINRRWAMLTLEYHPRTEAIAWARKVIAKRPRTRWIIVTHSCQKTGGGWGRSWSYGASSHATLRDRLVRKQKNIRAVVCGHNGGTTTTRDGKGATWFLTNRTTPGLVRVLDLTPTTVRSTLRSTR